MAEPLIGFATPEGTAAFRERHPALAEAAHFRDFGEISCSSIGIGTYLGREDEATDTQYTEAIVAAISRGVNVIDTAVNYRCQRSERAVGAALRQAIERDATIMRDELLIATKGGFLPFDGARPQNARAYFDENYVRPGLFRWEDVISGCHSIAPKFIKNQIWRSRKNLGVATIDIYYLHNPEMQLDEIPRPEFLKRMRAAIEVLEDARRRGELRWYGTATWNGFRAPHGEPGRLELGELLNIAREVAGDSHGFRVVQVPFNYTMHDALPFLEEAKGKVYVMTSASMQQGKLAKGLPPHLRGFMGKGLESDAQRAIQLARSTPGVGTALVGMKSTAHVTENTNVAKVPPLSAKQVRDLFSN